MKNGKIIIVDENTAYATKAFIKQSKIFGSDEWKKVRECKAVYPNIVISAKTVSKGNRSLDTKNMTYEHMIKYIETMEKKEELLKEFAVIRTRAKIQSNPYRFVLAWFMDKFNSYDGDYKKFFEDLKNAG